MKELTAHRLMQLLYRFCSICHGMLWRIRGAIQDEVTINTAGGRFSVSTRDHAVGGSIYRNGKDEDYDFSLRALTFLKNTGIIPPTNVTLLDVGANIGVISIGLLLTHLIDRAIAVEPEPRNFGLLCRNVDHNALRDQMLCVQKAVSDANSLLIMELSYDNFGDHRIRASIPNPTPGRFGERARRTIEVPCLTLPEVLPSPEVRMFGVSDPTVLWIDVQGHEGYVFKAGATSLVASGLPTVSEIWPYGILRAGMSLEDFFEVVTDIWTDYWIERRKRFTRYPIAVFDRYLEELGTDGHYENVIFTRHRD